MRRSAILLAAAATALLAAACGGPPPGQDACTLLTNAEASQALGGGPVQDERSAYEGDVPHRCYFRSQSRFILIEYETGSRSQFDSLETPGARPVAGIGDQAVWDPDIHILDILKGDQILQFGTSPEISQDQVLSLARAALRRL